MVPSAPSIAVCAIARDLVLTAQQVLRIPNLVPIYRQRAGVFYREDFSRESTGDTAIYGYNRHVIVGLTVQKVGKNFELRCLNAAITELVHEIERGVLQPIREGMNELADQLCEPSNSILQSRGATKS